MAAMAERSEDMPGPRAPAGRTSMGTGGVATEQELPATTASEASPAPDPRLQRRRKRATRVQLVVLVLNLVFWGAILGWTLLRDPSAYLPPDRLTDRALPATAEGRCVDGRSEIADLGLPLVADTPVERAETIDAENEVLVAMVDDLAELDRPADEQGAWVATWIEDWRTHIEDRQRWADRVRAGDDGPFVERVRGNDQVSSVVDNFAEVNEMESCATLEDV
jgi:hypothetical protein